MATKKTPSTATNPTEKSAAAPAADDGDGVSEKELSNAEGLLALFEARNPDGTFTHSDDDVRHFLPMLLLATGDVTPDLCTPEVLELLGEFSVRAGIKPGATPEERGAKINAFYEAFPPNPGLVDLVKKFLRAKGLDDGGPGLPSAALAKALGREASNVPVGAGERPQGAVGGGILGRLNAGKAFDAAKKSK